MISFARFGRVVDVRLAELSDRCRSASGRPRLYEDLSQHKKTASACLERLGEPRPSVGVAS
jgi:hypothetical protein